VTAAGRADPWPVASTRPVAVLGWPVRHSLSPVLHNAAFAELDLDLVYLALPVPPERLAEVVAALGTVEALGANVTVPHKVAVADLCDVLTEEARLIGAVNTLHFTDDGLVGDNTDATGLRDALERRRRPGCRGVGAAARHRRGGPGGRGGRRPAGPRGRGGGPSPRCRRRDRGAGHGGRRSRRSRRATCATRRRWRRRSPAPGWWSTPPRWAWTGRRCRTPATGSRPSRWPTTSSTAPRAPRSWPTPSGAGREPTTVWACWSARPRPPSSAGPAGRRPARPCWRPRGVRWRTSVTDRPSSSPTSRA
jgi:hypothetical protein